TPCHFSHSASDCPSPSFNGGGHTFSQISYPNRTISPLLRATPSPKSVSVSPAVPSPHPNAVDRPNLHASDAGCPRTKRRDDHRDRVIPFSLGLLLVGHDGFKNGNTLGNIQNHRLEIVKKDNEIPRVHLGVLITKLEIGDVVQQAVLQSLQLCQVLLKSRLPLPREAEAEPLVAGNLPGDSSAQRSQDLDCAAILVENRTAVLDLTSGRLDVRLYLLKLWGSGLEVDVDVTLGARTTVAGGIRCHGVVAVIGVAGVEH
ncbi:hypothetical protein QBC37DRAFT_464654, partial [Rhypophila decipiens]